MVQKLFEKYKNHNFRLFFWYVHSISFHLKITKVIVEFLKSKLNTNNSFKRVAGMVFGLLIWKSLNMYLWLNKMQLSIRKVRINTWGTYYVIEKSQLFANTSPWHTHADTGWRRPSAKSELKQKRACVAERLLSKLKVRFIRKILCWQGNYVYLNVGRSNGRVFSELQR